MQHGEEHPRRGVAAECRLTREQLIEDGPKAEDVGTDVEWPRFGLLGRHVRGRSADGVVRREREVGVRLHQRRDPEIEKLWNAVRRHEDVGGLQVAMKNAATMCLLQRAGDLQGARGRLVGREWTSKRLTFDVLQDEKVGTEIVDLTHIRVIQGRDRARFLLEPVLMDAPHALDRDGALQSRVPGLPYFSHSARANQGDQKVRAELDAGRPIGHGGEIL